MSVIEVADVHRAFGETQALRGVSFDVDRGQVVGLLGPNGAGKTTLLKILTGVLAPTVGDVRVAGHDVVTEPVAAKAQVGWLPEGAPLYADMTVARFLDFVARARGLGPSERARARERVIRQCGLDGRLTQAIGSLSRGYRQRVGLAQALVHQPAILVLDEPSTGLDPNQVVEIRDLVRTLGGHRTVLLSTHVLSEAQAICDRVIILHEGRVVADDRADRITEAARGQALVVGLGPSKVIASDARIAMQLSEIDGVTAVRALAGPGETRRFEVHAADDVRAAVFRWAVGRGHVLVELSERHRSLEAVFRDLTEAS